MDRNSIIGIILILVILIGYSIITRPSREKLAEQKRIAEEFSILGHEYTLKRGFGASYRIQFLQ